MPTDTFFNLPTGKREAIITAAKREFARMPFPEASIARIVQDASISRGSFYQYFADKEDLFFYLLNEDSEARKIELISSLQKNDGDIFKAMSAVFQSTLVELDNKEHRSFYRNVFLHLNYKTEKTLVKNIFNDDINKKYDDIKQLINKTRLNISNEMELFHIVHIISSIIMHNFVLKFAKNMSNEEVHENYETQINLLKKGFIKND